MSMISTVIPKSDQLNFDDFISGKGKIIEVTSVVIKPGEQPCTIHYKDDNGKPYKPNKSMCRVLFKSWGEDETKYVGRKIGLYGDPKVVFGGSEVGGILIANLSHIESPITVMLTKTKANKKPFIVRPFPPQAESK